MDDLVQLCRALLVDGLQWGVLCRGITLHNPILFIEMSTANACHSAHTFRAVQLPEGIRTAFLLLQDFVCRALYPRGQIDDVEFTS